MSLSQPVAESAPFASKSAIHCVFIDAECVLPSANRLEDYNTDRDGAYANGLVGAPYENLQILYTYQRICNFPGWGLPMKNKTYDPRTSYSSGGGGHSNCVEQYVEYIFSLRKELLGWRFHFVARDSEFSFDRGLMEAFKEETLRLAKLRHHGTAAPPPKLRKHFHLPTQQRQWVREYLSPYLGERFDDTPETMGELNTATTMDLNNVDNPAYTSRCMTLEWTNEVLLRRFGDRIDQNYRNANRYYDTVQVNLAVADNDFFEEAEPLVGVASVTKLKFPFGAYPVQHSCRNPKVLFFMDLRNPPDTVSRALELKYGSASEMDEDTKARYALRIMQEQNRRMRDEITRLTSASELALAENPILDPVKKKFKYDLSQCATPEEQHAYRCSEAAAIACTSVMFNDPDNPGDRIALGFLAEKHKVNPNWSTVEEKVFKLSADLSEFGNLAATRLIVTETSAGGVANLHKECFMVQITRCIAGDTEDPKLRLHFMFVGPPGSGKSFIIEMHDKTSIPGIMRWLSTQSDKANTTGEVYNGMQVLIDEAPPALVTGGLDNTGDANWKSFLSKGLIVTETCCFDQDTKERYSVFTVSKRKCNVIVATNARVSTIPDPIVKRFCVVDVPEQHRSDMDPILATRKMDSDPQMQKDYESYVDYWQKIQFLSFSLWARFRTTLFLKTNNALVLHISSLTFDYLYREHGIMVDKRDRERIMDMTTAVTIYHALHKVFISGDVVKFGEPYHPTQLAKVIPYIHSRREHFYFAFSLMDQIVANPCALIVLDALKHINNGYEEKFSPPNKERAYIDYNYYSVTLSSAANGLDVIPLIAKLVVLNVSNTTNFKFSVDSVRDILGKYNDMTTSCRVYDEFGALTSNTHRIPVIRIRSSGFRCGIEISRVYLDNAVTKRVNLVEEAIKATFDRHMPPHPIVTGMSKRYGYKNESSVPFIFTVIPVDKDRSKYPTLVLPKDNHETDMKQFFRSGKRMRMTESMYERCDYSIDDRCAEEWYARTGTRPAPEPEEEEEACYGSYPKDIIETYEREHARPGAEPIVHAPPTHQVEDTFPTPDEFPELYC